VKDASGLGTNIEPSEMQSAEIGKAISSSLKGEEYKDGLHANSVPEEEEEDFETSSSP
jgi:hypothetical protein